MTSSTTPHTTKITATIAHPIVTTAHPTTITAVAAVIVVVVIPI
jgi:hypothetical protein